MKKFSRVAVAAASFLGLFGAATFAAPSFASEAPASGSATAMLAAVTGPLLSVDVRTLQARDSSESAFQTAVEAESSSLPATAADDRAQSLEELVANNEADAAGDEQTQCLATTVYYESKGEPLSGQLAVAQTILNRTASGRFPSTACAVMRQPGQFSFVRSGETTPPPHNSAWQRAVAIATIAREKLWKQVAPAALFFHARRVSPGWGKIQVASLGNHIFFR